MATAGGDIESVVVGLGISQFEHPGEIIAAGPGTLTEQGTLRALDVKAGDRVLFGKWSGTEVKIDGEDLMIMKESDLLGVITKA